MRSRYYSPDLRQFLSADRYMGDLYHPASLNPYSYVEGNPVRHIDPMGYAAVNAMRIPRFRKIRLEKYFGTFVLPNIRWTKL